jgi:hypothetical protein
MIVLGTPIIHSPHHQALLACLPQQPAALESLHQHVLTSVVANAIGALIGGANRERSSRSLSLRAKIRTRLNVIPTIINSYGPEVAEDAEYNSFLLLAKDTHKACSGIVEVSRYKLANKNDED